MSYITIRNLIKSFLPENTKKKLKKYFTDFLRPQRIFINNVFLNKLGLQVIRILWTNFLWKIKFFKSNVKKNDTIYNELDEKGIVVIQNFFSNEDYEFLMNELNKIEKENYFSLTENHVDSNVNWLTGKIYSDFERTNKIYYLIDKNFKRYLPYIEKVLKLKINSKITYSYQNLYLPLGKKDIKDSNATWHHDRMFPCIKSFIILEDCMSLENGPYNYMIGSHKLNLNRIKNEYLNSVWWVDRIKNKNKYKALGEDAFNKRLDYLENCEKKPILAPKNSLIISNNMGFHKRGRLMGGFSRKMIRILFYDFQLPYYKRFLKKIVTNYTDKNKIKNLSNSN